MRDFFGSWTEGLSYLITDDLISFYAYITTVLAEIAFLWGFFPEKALPFTILLCISILNIFLCSGLKGMFEGTKLELIIARGYAIIFVILFIIGFFFGWLANIILFAIPLAITFLCTNIRIFQTSIFIGKFNKVIEFFAKIFSSKVVVIIAQLFILFTPFIIFAIGIFLTGLPNWAKFLILMGYALLVPFIPLLEDNLAAENIFELAFQCIWSKEYEEKMKAFRKKVEEDPEQALHDAVENVRKSLEDLEKTIEDVEKQNDK